MKKLIIGLTLIAASTSFAGEGKVKQKVYSDLLRDLTSIQQGEFDHLSQRGLKEYEDVEKATLSLGASLVKSITNKGLMPTSNKEEADIVLTISSRKGTIKDSKDFWGSNYYDCASDYTAIMKVQYMSSEEVKTVTSHSGSFRLPKSNTRSGFAPAWKKDGLVNSKAIDGMCEYELEAIQGVLKKL